MTKDEALALADSKWWEGKTPSEIVAFQLYERRLCMPFGEYHEAVEAALGRPVWTHEFAFPDRLKAEFESRAEKPTMTEIMDLIPADKRVVVVAGGDHD